MNTNTHQETQALHAAVFTPAAATMAAYDLLLIPLSQLRPSSRNTESRSSTVGRTDRLQEHRRASMGGWPDGKA